VQRVRFEDGLTENEGVMPKFSWEPITDIPENLYTYTDPGFHQLVKKWGEVRGKTPKSTMEIINSEIRREWAIETGKIEGLYTLTKGMTETLIKHGISAKLISHSSTNRDPELVAAMLQDQHDVIEGLFDFVGQRRTLSLSYIREMHQTFTRHQDTTVALTPEGKLVEVTLIKGDWKKWPNNPLQKDVSIHEYCPPEHVPAEMDRLVKMHTSHIEKKVHPEVEAAFLHHRFTQIHPFQDGNGRVARALASLVFLRGGDFPCVVRDEERAGYISALEAADEGHLLTLIEFMVEKQKVLMLKALSQVGDIRYDRRTGSIQEGAKMAYLETQPDQALINHTNQIIQAWQESAEDVLKKFQESLAQIPTDKGSLGDEFEFVPYHSIHKNLRLPDDMQMVPGGARVTVAINFQNRTLGVLRLYLCSMGEQNTPEKLYAALQHQFGRQIGSLMEDVDVDLQTAKTKFNDWFSAHMDAMIKSWLD
jgi:Fic family protein